jgi:hypothetical protein
MMMMMMMMMMIHSQEKDGREVWSLPSRAMEEERIWEEIWKVPGGFFEEFLHIVFSKMAMSAIIDFLNHRHWLCLAHSHHSHLHSLAKLPFVLLNMKAKQTQGFADCACKILFKIMLKRHEKKLSRRL